MLAAGAVGAGTRLLDAGCGAGGASLLAARRGAWVNGLDAAAGLLAIARERVPDADFFCGDLEALPYADEAFDVIIAAEVLPYVADPLAALRELRRVCMPGGCVIVAVWGAPEDCVQHALVGAVRSLLARPLDGEPFALSGPGVLDALLAEAGLRVRAQGTVRCPQVYADLESAYQAQASLGPFQGALRVVGATTLKAALLAALAPYAAAAGGVHQANQWRHVTAVPAGAPLRR
jgi:SAM-dependent methyltransferase